VPHQFPDFSADCAPDPRGRWYVEVLWNKGDGMGWQQSFAHHIAHPYFDRGFDTLTEAHEWGVAKYPDIAIAQDPINGFFRMRFVWSTDGPPKDTQSNVELWELGGEQL